MSTFNKIYKKVANNGNSNDYQVVGQVGVNGVPLDIMKGANNSSAGEIGLVPKPVAGANNRYLRSDGTWSVPPVYSHPTHTSHGNGLYKISVDGSGHVNSVSSVTKSDITNLGIPGQDTTYGLASSSSNGLMSAMDKLIHDLYSNCFIMLGYLDVQISVGAVDNNTTRYFNQHFENKCYNHIDIYYFM